MVCTFFYTFFHVKVFSEIHFGQFKFVQNSKVKQSLV